MGYSLYRFKAVFDFQEQCWQVAIHEVNPGQRRHTVLAKHVTKDHVHTVNANGILLLSQATSHLCFHSDLNAFIHVFLMAFN